MQLTPLQGNYIEKILRDKAGRLVRVTFYVYVQNGRLKGRIIDTVCIEEGIEKREILLISASKQNEIVSSELSSERAIPSPYFNSTLLFLSGSKPRAPAFL